MECVKLVFNPEMLLLKYYGHTALGECLICEKDKYREEKKIRILKFLLDNIPKPMNSDITDYLVEKSKYICNNRKKIVESYIK